MNHIDKMSDGIWDAFDEGSFSYNFMAQDAIDVAATHAFNALMDAVPDLVWGESSLPYVLSQSQGYEIHAKPARSRDHISPYDVALFFKGGRLSSWSTARDHLVAELKADANTHHREQVRKIWTHTTQQQPKENYNNELK